MQQLSRGYQIALGAVFLLALVWFAALKPSGESDSAAATIPPPAAAARAPTAATGATGTTGAAKTTRTVRKKHATGTPGATGATGATGTTGATGVASGPAAPILRDVAAGKVAVVLFYAAHGSDDAAVRDALLGVNRRAGRVSVRAIPIGRVGAYKAITDGVDVSQAPTVLVIGPHRNARTLVGLADTRAVDQLVGDVGGSGFHKAVRRGGFAAQLERVCETVSPTLRASALDDDQLYAHLTVLNAVVAGLTGKQARPSTVPARFRPFLSAFVANLRLTIAAYSAVGDATSAHHDATAAFAPYKTRLAASNARVERAARQAHLAPGC